MIPIMVIVDAAYANHQRQYEELERRRLLAMPPDQRDFELRLREVRAQEAIAAQRPVINIRNSLF